MPVLTSENDEALAIALSAVIFSLLLEEKREKEAKAIKKKLKHMIYWRINCYQCVDLIHLSVVISFKEDRRILSVNGHLIG